jgi:arsenate reductase-like glutaredoxin family protein
VLFLTTALPESRIPGMDVQIFGTKKSADTRKALRFFAERRVRVHFVDLTERGMAPAELNRFAQKFGVGTLIDGAGRRFADLGLRSARYSDEHWLGRLADDPLLLRAPLVRWGRRLTVGLDEAEWKDWMASAVRAEG